MKKSFLGTTFLALLAAASLAGCSSSSNETTAETAAETAEESTAEAKEADGDLEKYPRGRRGSPAKGVGRDTVARVQIPASPPDLPRIPGFSGEFFSSLHFPASAGVIR